MRHHSSLVVTEMLPAPDELLMGDDTYPSSRVAAEIVVRVPADGELAQLAQKIADRLTLMRRPAPTKPLPTCAGAYRAPTTSRSAGR